MNEMMLTLAQTALATQGTLIGATADAAQTRFARVNSDSRNVQPGDLFVALKGDLFDGHDFVAQALQDGTVAAIVERGREWPPGLNLLEVDDTLVALGHLGQAWRQQFDLPIIAVTGSNGKTSVKDMLATILRHKAGDDAVLATAGNLNNHIGLPLMLTRLRATHRYAVLEMGMNHFGEISYLTRLAQPSVALINNAGAGHLEFLGSVEGVARAKGEIFEGLANNGVAVVNADDAFAHYWRGLAGAHPMLDFGLTHGAITSSSLQLGPLSSHFILHTPRGEVEVSLSVPGVHNVRNALAAAAAAHAVGLDAKEIAVGLANYTGTKGRLQQKRAANGALLLDDTYNANPNSMRAAVDVLAQLAAPRILVLGDMGEVGSDIEMHHRELGAYAKSAGIERLFATGEQMRHAVDAFGSAASWYADHAALVAALIADVPASASVLVKGSRFMRMERVVDELMNPANTARAEK
jgi:UDP-N-acetylmuramoyl-tripeptide--D-alanyl-D-alanine ligase